MAEDRTRCRCPRCGYDLSGVVDSWREQCPLEGVCSECGLGFAWGKVLNPLLRLPGWSFEHAAERRLRALTGSLVMSLRPMRLWSELELQHPIRKGRLVIMTLVVFALLYTLCAASAGHVQWELSTQSAAATAGRVAISPLRDALRAAIWPFTLDGPRIAAGWLTARMHGRFRLADGWIQLGIVWAFVLPLTLVLVPETMRRCRVRSTHALRCGAYTLSAFALVMFLVLALRAVPLSEASRQNFFSFRTGSLASSVIRMTLGDSGLRAFGISGLALSCCWLIAVHRYLRLDRAIFVACIQIMIALMLAFVAVGSLRHGPVSQLGEWMAFGVVP